MKRRSTAKAENRPDSIAKKIFDQIHEEVRTAGIQFTDAMRPLSEKAARRQRAEAAWQHVAAFHGDAIPYELTGDSLWQRQAELLVDLGKVLLDDGWQTEIDALEPGSPPKQFAIAILRTAMTGDVESVASQLQQAMYGNPAVDPVFQLGAFAIPVDDWLRVELMYEVLQIERQPDSPSAFEKWLTKRRTELVSEDERLPSNLTKPPMTPDQQLVFELLQELPEGEAMPGNEIIGNLKNEKHIDQSTLTSRIIPFLKEHYGVKNRRGAGYYIEKSI